MRDTLPRSPSVRLPLAALLLALAGCAPSSPPTPFDSLDARADLTPPDVPAVDRPTPLDAPSLDASIDSALDASIDASPADATPDVASEPSADAPSDVACGDRACASAEACCDGRCVNPASDRFHCGGCGLRCSEGAECCAGVCTGIFENDAHCGACGVSCGGLAHATAGRCGSGRCAVVTCAAGYGDCDLDGANGCEVALDDSVRHCGRCDNACIPVSFGAAYCAAGRCAARCVGSQGDCDGDPTDCETALDENFNHCGACGNRCPTPAHGVAGCLDGRCVAVCDPGYVECDGDPANGCESAPLTDTANCGLCGRRCTFAHAAGACTGGLCAVSRCDAGFGDCNLDPSDGCEVDLRADPSRCGSCFGRCETGAVCASGVCGATCAAGFANCGGVCRSVTDDTNHCGACGRVCAPPPGATTSCVAGSCAPVCASGRGDCDRASANGCEVDLYADVNHCGACANRCTAPAGATAVCRGGRCAVQCPDGRADCDGDAANGCEATLATSIEHCGACGQSCGFSAAEGACVAGRCALRACNTGFANCDANDANGCETPIAASDPNHCGACGTRCGAGLVCAVDRCVVSCAAGQSLCAFNACANLMTDASHCGSCTTACAAGQTCTSGRCTYPPLPNDLCTASMARPGFHFGAGPGAQSIRFDTRGAARELRAPCVTGANSGGDVFYQLTLAAPSIVYADTRDTDFDPVLFFVRDCLVPEPRGPGAGFAYCNDDPATLGCAPDANPQIVGSFPAGTYYLAVAGAAPGAQGTGSLRVQTLPLATGGTGSGYVADRLSARFTGTLTGVGSVGASCGAPGPEAIFWWRSCAESRGGAIHVSGRLSDFVGLSPSDASIYLLDANHGADVLSACARQPTTALIPGSGIPSPEIRPTIVGGGGIHGVYFDAASASTRDTYAVSFLSM